MNANEPAFPGQFPPINIPIQIKPGLTKREYFAAMAMQGIMGNPNTEPLEPVHFKNIAEDSIRIADELLKQLEL
jgi:hypothetical protein